MLTILEFMESLGISYPEPNSAWRDFYRWYWAVPWQVRPSVRGDSHRKFIIPMQNKGAN